MKRFAGWLLFFWGCICCICASEISITDSWKYKAENDERFSSMDWNDSDWVTVDLPHTWNAGDVIDEQRGLAMVSLYSLWKADDYTGQPRRG